MARSYDMSRRSAQAERTGERIVDATEALVADGPLSEVTLSSIADGAGVTVQTVLRHMGSREGCLEALGRRVATRIAEQRGHTEPGDTRAAIAELTAHYEAEGRLVLNLLSQEQGADATAARAVAEGRAFHRAWVERCFDPVLPQPDEQTIDALVAATDLYVWKLLRLDLGRSRSETEAVITRLTHTALEAS
ncbi:MAG: TetR/AcrR family transcriptional regulator [Candidatus Nanopelagicales bacterium]